MNRSKTKQTKAERTDEPKSVLTKKETATFLGCSERTVDNLVNRGILPVVYLTARPLFRRSSLEAVLAERESHGRKKA